MTQFLIRPQGELSLASADGALLCLGGESSGDDWWKTICFYSANGNPVRIESETLVMERDVFRYTTILWRTIRHKAQTGLLMKNSIRAFGLINFHLGGMEQKKNQIIS